ncbi:MAG: UbiA family prenyltransferase [Syntrophomonadaceae bacterium]|nr:UbiA family prenyltransferase [Syntrophomonadaceae bacterium]
MTYWQRFKSYLALTKPKQTFLLVVTGAAGFGSVKCPIEYWGMSWAILGTLFLAVGGCTVFNMIYDRDIDQIMPRTSNRPLPAGDISLPNALLFASVLTATGVGWAFTIYPLYGWIILAGVFLDAIVYTVLLKRTTPFSIIYGGLSGGMPILAGRSLALGQIDLLGILLALAIVLWIPTHIMTFSIKYSDEYARAKIPTFPSTYGVDITRKIISWSTIFASLAMVTAGLLIGLEGYCLFFLILFSLVLSSMAVLSVVIHSLRLNYGLFKVASVYMLGCMLLFIFVQ